jgi:hypothetical protein
VEGLNLNTAKSLIGKNVNLHLRDGSVIVNVVLSEVQRDSLNSKPFMKCTPHGRKNTITIPLKNIAWAELVTLQLFLANA